MMTLALEVDIQSTQGPGPKAALRSHSLYNAVQLEKHQMRLLDLLPGSFQEPIQSRLFTVNNPAFSSYNITHDEESTKLTYDALSYVWASDEDDAIVSVNDTLLKISANLNHALHSLRLPNRIRTLWIDAICINQDDEKEKSDQVCRMDLIYSNADNVLIYLGPEGDESSIVMNYLTVEDSQLLDGGELFTEASARDTRAQGKVMRLSVEREREFLTEYFAQQGLEENRVAQAAYAFFCRPWWTRIWVVQEAKLAKRDPVWYCGRQSATMQNLRERLPALHNFTLIKKQPSFIPVEQVLGPNTRGRRKQFEELMAWARGVETIFFTVDQEYCSIERLGLSGWLRRCTNRHSTDPRDRIFALIGMLGSVGRAVLTPNYSMSTSEVFFMATQYMLFTETSTLAFHLYSFNREKGKPSWGLDFTKPLPEDANHWLDDYLSSCWYAKTVNTDIYSNRLVLSGIDFDLVRVASNIDEGASSFEILEAIHKREKLISEHSRVLVRPRLTPRPDILGSFLLPPSFRDDNKTLDHINTLQGLESSSKELLRTLVRSSNEIPGAVHFSCEVLKAVATLVAELKDTMNCGDLEHFNSLSSRAAQHRVRLRAAISVMTPEFLNAAAFELSCFKPPFDGFSQGEAGIISTTSGFTAASHECTQLQATLRGVPCHEDLNTMIAVANDMAHICHATVVDHVESGACSLTANIDASEKWFFSAYAATKALLDQTRKNCTCSGDQRGTHCALIATLLCDMSQEELMFQHVFNLLKKRRETEHFEFQKLAIQRRHKAMFLTSSGFLGIAFQHDPEFDKGDKVVLMNGFLAPMILREEGGSGQFRIKGAAYVVGLNDVDLESLIENGVLQEQRFEII